MCIRDSHCLISVHLVTQHSTVRDERRVIEWERFGPAFSRRLPEHIPLDTTQHVDESVALFDTAVVSAVAVSYTHLDVYKRQVYKRDQNRPKKHFML